MASLLRLGKKAPKHDIRTLQLKNYLKALPNIPSYIDYSKKVTNLGMMANDQLGDCTCAAAGHMIQTWTANVGNQIILSDNDIIKAYEGACGYKPSDPATDQGGIEIDVLNYWRTTGIGGHKIGAYVALEPKNIDHIRAAIYLFGGAYIGVALPTTAQNQPVWRTTFGGTVQGDPTPGSWGGHAVPVTTFGPNGLSCVTWGANQPMTYTWWETYCDEAYAIISQDWFDNNDKAPNGFNITALQADLQLVTQ